MSYAVLWSEQEGLAHAGKLEVRDRSLVLDGADGSGRVRRELPLAEIRSVRIARGLGERLGGRPALVLQLTPDRMIRIATLSGAGALHEIVDHVSKGRSGRCGVAGMRPLASR